MTAEEDGRTRDGAYYESRVSSASPARQSGWRRRIGQWARFEMALAPWDGSDVQSVLDLGSGTGELARYLEVSGRELEYAGIERRMEAVDTAAERHEGAEFIHGDLYDREAAESRDLAVAIGAQVDGRAPASDRDRRSRVERLVERCVDMADRGVSCVVLDEDAVRRRRSLGTEPALFGATGSELEAVADAMPGPAVTTHAGLRTDRLLAGATGEEGPSPRSFDVKQCLNRVVDVHRAHGGSRLDEAWLWLESGLFGRARAILEEIESTEARYRHLVDRLRKKI